MRIAEFAVKRYQFTIVVFLLAVAVGISSLQAIPRGEDPTFPLPQYLIVAVYPGASSTELEELVVDKLESRINELDHLKRVNTRINDGVAVINVEFDAGSDAERKYDEVLRQVNAERPQLPSELYSLDVNKMSSSHVNIVQLAVVSATAPFRDLEAIAKRITDRIETVKGVRRAERWGYPARELHVSVDLGRLAALRIPVGQVVAALMSDNTIIPGGSVDVGLRRFNVKTSGSYKSLEQVRSTVLRGANGTTVRVGDVAQVQWGYADATYIGRYNGQRAVFVSANMLDGQNVKTVRDGIWRELDVVEQSLPASVRLERGFDQSRNVSHRLTELTTAFGIAILLVLVTLLPLGLRSAVIVMISIPLSLAIGLSILYFTGFSINQLSIVGFVIALGLLVDDSIVVIENIARFIRAGYSRRDAAIAATRQIGVAVLGCTAALIFAFLPLLFLPGAPGDYIRSMPAAVIFTIIASLFVSLTIIPFLASLVLDEGTAAHGNRYLRLLTRGIERFYAPLLHRALAHPAVTLLVAVALFAGSVALVPVVGFSLFPKAETPQFRVTVETPDGSSLDATDAAVRHVERALVGRPDVRSVFANVGHGNPQVYYNVLARQTDASVAELFVLLDEYDGRRTPLMLDSLRARFADYAGAKIQVKEYENGPPVDAPIAMRIRGENLDTLRLLATRAESLIAQIPGAIYVNNPVRVSRTDLRVSVDADKAGLLNVPTAEVNRTIRMGIAGLQAGKYRDANGEEYPITVRLPSPGGGRQSLDVLDQVYVSSTTGAQVPLQQLARLDFAASPALIQHYDRERTVTVSAFVATGYSTDRLTTQAIAALDRIAWPSGYRYTVAGEYESRQESFGGLGTAILVATFGILAILVLEFGTFKSTLIVASVIPLGVVGGVLALFAAGYTLSFTAVIGFVALIGIEIKNSILLVDFTNQLREEGMPLDEAIERAGQVRFLPIVLTTMTAIGGLIPLAAQGSGLYSPLAVVIIGGLISSTVLARLVTPVMYKLLAPSVGTESVPSRVPPIAAQAPVLHHS